MENWAGPMSHMGHLRRYGDVRSLVCYRRYRTLLRPTETRVLVAFLRGCNESARKLLPGLFAWFLSDRNFREGQRRTGDSIVSSARRLLCDRQRIAGSPEEFLQLGEVGVAPQLARRRQGRLRNLDLAPEMTCRAMRLGGAILFQDRLLGPATLACMRAARVKAAAARRV